MKTILLKVDNNGLHYNSSEYIPWTATNMPVGDFRFRSHETIYWLARMLAYDPEKQLLELEILDYEVADITTFVTQQPRRVVRTIKLAPLAEGPFKAQLSYYKTGSLERVLQSDAPKNSVPIAHIQWTTPPQQEHLAVPSSPIPEPVSEPLRTTFELSFGVTIHELSFGLGEIIVEEYIEQVGYVLSFSIANDFIIPEFNHIKAYFAKVWQHRSLPIKAVVEMENGKVVTAKARSPKLEGIDEKFLELVRAVAIERVLEKPKIVAIDKSLFTADEMFATFEEKEIKGDVFGTPDEDLLRKIVELRKVRNTKQLQYLAGKLHESGEKLRFTLTPLFGFIFVVKGEQMNHFIWELLNSHATYIWSCDGSLAEKSIDRQFKELEKILNFIKTNGRKEYRNNHHLSSGFRFHLIHHQHAKSNFIDGFPRWRNLLLEKLV